MSAKPGSTVAVPKSALPRMLENLRAAGFRLVGPAARGSVIAIEEIESSAALPFGVTDEQQPGHYRVRRNGGESFFGFNNGADGWRRWLQPPSTSLFATDASLERSTTRPPDGRKLALIGVRACDLAGIAVLDAVLMNGEWPDPAYAAIRTSAFVLAVNCTTAAATCFCASMDTGPRAAAGFDLALTELPDGFVIEVGSDAGSEALEGSEWTPATAFDIGRVQQALAKTEASMRREVRTDHLGSVLFENLESPRWNDLAARCLGCGNCTMVCPTCFCTAVHDRIGLDGRTERVREWDTCFNTEYSKVHGGSTRPSLRARCRQFVTHKFASLREQFGIPGCTGCGRCITWCPVGIDVTEELPGFRAGGAR